MRAVIHQPDFLPWLGLFHKIAFAERFVVFDHVQAPRGKSWHNRNRLLIGGKPAWVTVPIERKGTGFPRYHEVRINQAAWNRKKQLRSIEMSYRKAACFEEIFPSVQALFEGEHELLIDLNLAFIRQVCKGLDLHPTFISSRSLLTDHPELDELQQNELVLGICKAAGTTHYLSGKGCLDFIDPPSFEAEGIRFEFQEFEHPVYPQAGPRGAQFESHLSILDALFNVGYAGVAKLLAGEA